MEVHSVTDRVYLALLCFTIGASLVVTTVMYATGSVASLCGTAFWCSMLIAMLPFLAPCVLSLVFTVVVCVIEVWRECRRSHRVSDVLL